MLLEGLKHDLGFELRSELSFLHESKGKCYKLNLTCCPDYWGYRIRFDMNVAYTPC